MLLKRKSDLSAKEGRVVLMEYVEEHPTVIQNLGMGSKLRNFYRKRNSTENPLLKFDDGENILMDEEDPSPFILGDIEPGN